ncbi:ATP-binding protein [Candidatus Bathyarchaeota archaeon]|nr:ATP-binding protein [Candidatus Bathyarchaeota archaeon]
MDGSMKIGHTYSMTGEYELDKIIILLIRGRELAKGDLVYLKHPKNNLPIIYQVTRVYPHKRVREYEEALLSEGKVIGDIEDSTLHAEAHQWGWMDDDGCIRTIRYPIPPNAPIFLAERQIVEKFTKPAGEWKFLLGTDPTTDLDVELGIYPLIRQSCLICGSVGTGKTTTAVSMIARAVNVTPPVRFFIIDKDGEYSSLVDNLGVKKALKVPWNSFFHPGDIPWDDYIAEFGWQKSWWNSKILFQALKILYSQSATVTKNTLKKALHLVNPDKLGFNKKDDEFQLYKMQVENAIQISKLIPLENNDVLDPVALLKERLAIVMDLSDGKDTWEQKHLVVAQVLRKIFNEALENRKFGCIIVLEEAMYYAPQYGVFEIGEKESRGKLLGVIKEIATNGGRNGIGLWVVTQRLATVEKTVITQCANNIICHSLEDLDKQRLAEIMGQEFTELIGDLPPGEAIVKGTALKCRFPLWVKILPELYPSSSLSTPMSRFLYMNNISK